MADNFNSNVLAFLEKAIARAELAEDGATLILEFGARSLRLDGGDKVFECYHLRVGVHEFVV